MVCALKVLGTILIFCETGGNWGKRERSLPFGILFSQIPRPELGGRQAEQGKVFHPNNLICQNMLDIFISVEYT